MTARAQALVAAARRMAERRGLPRAEAQERMATVAPAGRQG
ncbi:MAG TPA: hypothetical protein VG276_17395 [Actinomycetes bacterium]|nr:hypothetical protein [Actinomycetes bacterium]